MSSIWMNSIEWGRGGFAYFSPMVELGRNWDEGVIGGGRGGCESTSIDFPRKVVPGTPLMRAKAEVCL